MIKSKASGKENRTSLRRNLDFTDKKRNHE
jgi:hypothetical protein